MSGSAYGNARVWSSFSAEFMNGKGGGIDDLWASRVVLRESFDGMPSATHRASPGSDDDFAEAPAAKHRRLLQDREFGSCPRFRKWPESDTVRNTRFRGRTARRGDRLFAVVHIRERGNESNADCVHKTQISSTWSVLFLNLSP